MLCAKNNALHHNQFNPALRSRCIRLSGLAAHDVHTRRKKTVDLRQRRYSRSQSCHTRYHRVWNCYMSRKARRDRQTPLLAWMESKRVD
jgi:hypothetical protein